MIIAINTDNNVIRRITKNELEHFAIAQRTNLVSISQYYVRDNRFFEFYLLLQYLLFLRVVGKSTANRVDSIISNMIIFLSYLYLLCYVYLLKLIRPMHHIFLVQR